MIILSLQSLIFVIGRGYIGGSALQVGQVVEWEGKEYKVKECLGLGSGNKYRYKVEA